MRESRERSIKAFPGPHRAGSYERYRVMRSSSLLAAGIVLFLATTPGIAQPSETPGVTEIAPGVREIDGSKVPSTQISVAALKSAIAQDQSFKTISKLFKVKGIQNPGPAGTTTHMYKITDTDTGEEKVVILFVKSKKIVDYLVT